MLPESVELTDNESTSMTGGQDSSAKGRIESICEGVGVDPAHIRVLNPVKKNHEEMYKVFKEEAEYQGVSVIIPRRVCIQKHALVHVPALYLCAHCEATFVF